jgi:hypothetical protein
MAIKLSINNIIIEYKGNKNKEVKDVNRDSPQGNE